MKQTPIQATSRQTTSKWMKLFCIALLASSLSLLGYAQDEDPSGSESKAETNVESEADNQQTNNPKTTERKLPDTQQKHVDLLVDELQDTAIQWLGEGEEKFPIIWEQEASGKPFGALLFLHGEGQTLNWPETLSNLRINLLHFGWSTLSIGMPGIAKQSIPARPAPPEPTKKLQQDEENTDNTNKEMKSEDAPETQSPDPKQANQSPPAEVEPANPLPSNAQLDSVANQRIKAAIQFLKERGQFNIIVITYGISALRMAKYIDEQPNANSVSKLRPGTKAVMQRPIQAFIMIDPSEHAHMEDKKMLMDYFRDPGLPILDIYYGNHYLEQLSSKARREAARRLRLTKYEQSKFMPPSKRTEEENGLTRRVRGFLNKHAKGVEINKAKRR